MVKAASSPTRKPAEGRFRIGPSETRILASVPVGAIGGRSGWIYAGKRRLLAGQASGLLLHRLRGRKRGVRALVNDEQAMFKNTAGAAAALALHGGDGGERPLYSGHHGGDGSIGGERGRGIHGGDRAGKIGRRDRGGPSQPANHLGGGPPQGHLRADWTAGGAAGELKALVSFQHKDTRTKLTQTLNLTLLFWGLPNKIGVN